MKKINYILMAFAVAATTSLSCTKEETNVPEHETGAIDVTLTTGEIITKTNFDGSAIGWLSTDQLGVMNESLDENQQFTQASYDGVRETTTFSGTVDATGVHYAYYPYSAAMKIGSGAIITVPNTQVLQNNGSFAANADLLVSESINIGSTSATVSGIRFRRLMSFIDFQFVDGSSAVDLSSEAIESLTVTAEVDLVGKVTLNPKTGELSAITDGSKSVYVGRVASAIIGASHNYAGVVPQTLTAGSTLTVTVNTVHHKIQKTITVPAGGIELKSGHIQPFRITITDGDFMPKLTKLWGTYGEAGVCGWPGKVAGIEDLDGNIRNATFDDDYVYIPKTKGVKDGSGDNFTEYKIFMFNISDGSYAGLVTPATDPAYMAGTWASTFPVSCARVMKNTEPTVNGGKDILVCTNLCDAQNVRLYAWVNGVDQQPRLLTNFTSARRFGDRISVEGTYQNGRVWYRSFAGGMTAYINLVPDYTGGFNGSHAWNWVEALGATATEDGDSMITEYTSFNEGAFGIVSSNSGKGIYLLTGTTTTKNYADYKRCWGWHAFEFNGVNYIAYLDLSTGTDKPIVTVIKGGSSTVGELQATLDAKEIVARAAFATADVNDFSTGTAYATNNVGECEFRVIGGEPYILGATRGSIALFKLEL